MNPAENQTSKPNTDGKSPQLPSSHSEETEATKAQDRTQPIPPPSHPRQYRAIGLIKARYEKSEEQLTQGYLITANGTKLKLWFWVE